MKSDVDQALGPSALQTLVDNHRRFLSFLKPRVRTTQDAEEILQTAFVKAVESDESLREESVIAWFYRLLRNALTDYYRRQSVEQRDWERRRNNWSESAENHELERTVCACVQGLLDTLKPEQGTLVRRVDLEGADVASAAVELGITPNNASVRLHRGRHALKERLVQTCGVCATHGCFDCSCASSKPETGGSD